MKRVLAIGMTVGLFSASAFGIIDPSKESYLKKSQAEVQEWTAKLKALQERSEKSGSETRQELDQKLKVVQDQLSLASKKLDALTHSSEGSWDHFRQELEEALRDVKRNYRKAASFFDKKDAKEKS